VKSEITKAISVLLLPLLLPLLAQASDETTLPFSDLEQGTKYYDAISYLYNQGIISGYADGTFKPNQEVNRAETLKILLLSSNIEPETTTGSIFSDVEGTEWYFPYLSEGVEKKIVAGYDDGTFKPENSVNLVETLKMFVNTNELIPTFPKDDDEFFPDAEKNAWYTGYLNYSCENALIYQDSQGMINPGKNITRAQLADIIYRYKNPGYYTGEVGYGKATFYADYFEGMTTASGDQFDQMKLTAAHMTLPFGTIVRVTNIENNKTVEVEINDRGPYIDGHVLDLSKVAFQEIGKLSTGIINIEYEIVTPAATE